MSRMTGYIPTLDQIDELHKKIAPSQAAYDLVHTHCVVVATIARQLARHQNALFTNKLGQGSGNALDDSAGAAEQADLPSDGITGGRVPKRLIDEHLATAACCTTSARIACSSMTAVMANRCNSTGNVTSCMACSATSTCWSRAWTSPSPSSRAIILGSA